MYENTFLQMYTKLFIFCLKNEFKPLSVKSRSRLTDLRLKSYFLSLKGLNDL